jgi:glutamine synthetase
VLKKEKVKATFFVIGYKIKNNESIIKRIYKEGHTLGLNSYIFLPDNIYDAIRLFKGSRFVNDVLGETVAGKFAELKQMQADRCPKALGTLIKTPEIQFHHEVTNQHLWNLF